jgi:tRNA nucleotidyltransferase (CCA-adding enzyme)
MTGFKAYVVGGAVRDALLGLPVKDRDYVVVGATPEQMLNNGFTAVGKDFPVFLHPQTHEEYALARTERKTAPGYSGFAFHAAVDVTLEQDLQRRDLTINAIAQDADGTLIDPYGGQADLAAKVFRHVSAAFAEDPVRILRVARFAARFNDFSVAPETMALMRQMVSSGEVDALVAERVWQELSRGLLETAPSRMFILLHECGALARIVPELDALVGIALPEHVRSESLHQEAEYSQPAAGAALNAWSTHHQITTDAFAYALKAADYAAQHDLPIAVRFAVLLPEIGHAAIDSPRLPEDTVIDARAIALAERVCQRLRVPHEVRDLAIMLVREHVAVARIESAPAAAMVRLFERGDAFRKPARFLALLDGCECFYAHHSGATFPQKPLLQHALAAAQSVNAGAIANKVIRAAAERTTEKIPDAIHAARVQAVAQALGRDKPPT